MHVKPFLPKSKKEISFYFLPPGLKKKKIFVTEFPHVAHSYFLSIIEKLLRSLGLSSHPNFLSWEMAQTPSCLLYHLTLKRLCFLKTRDSLPAQSTGLMKVMHQDQSPLPSPILGLHGEERERESTEQFGRREVASSVFLPP